MFKDAYKADNARIRPTPETRACILSTLRETQASGKAPLQSRHTRQTIRIWKAAGAAFACLLILCSGIFAVKSILMLRKPAAEPRPVNTESVSGLSAYDEVYDIFSNISYNSHLAYGTEGGALSSAEAAEAAPKTAVSEDKDVPMDGAAEAATDSSADYSETNVQVEGIDEGDSVKTDGKYLYRLENNVLSILSCEGKNTKLLSQTQVADGSCNEELNGGSFLSTDDACAIYLIENGNAVAVVKSTWRYSDWWDEGTGDSAYSSDTATAVSVYDVSDRTAPTLSAKFKQDGSYLTSRILDGVLYLISNDAKDGEPVETKPETYVPCIEENGTEHPIDAGCIYIVPEPDSTQYTVISAIRLSDCSLISNQSVLGGGTEFYMSQNNLYFSRAIYDTEEGDAYTEDGYDVQEYKDSSHTELLRFSLQDGNIAPEAEGEVPGYLLNQFAMDEYEGNLRVVTTQDENTYRTYTDSKHGWVNYQADRDVQENALYVLDASLKIIGKIEGLAEDERVYSVRFAGETGYFVTFRETDPLFSVDLRNPEEPKIMGKLKIPGFSSYLHVYGNGLLFGLGMDADEETGITNGLKLSMFDTSDPHNVTELHTMYLESDWSEALYNHKAILIAPERDLIAFPAENGYAIYGYSTKTGFYPKATVEGDLDWSAGDTRGVYADEDFYVFTDHAVTVFRMEDFTELVQLSL